MVLLLNGRLFLHVHARRTVGYGDFAPVTQAGRLMSVVIMPFGTIVTMRGLLTPLGVVFDVLSRLNALIIAIVTARSREAYKGGRRIWRRCCAALCGGTARRTHRRGAHMEDAEQCFTLHPLGRERPIEVGWIGALVHAVMTPVLVVLIMCAITSAGGKGFVDSLYYGMVTMTTVGYGDGDLLPISNGQKAYTIVFVLFSTTALVSCVERLQILLTSRRVFLQDFNLELPHMMRREAIKESRSEPVIVEDEFVLHVLQEYGIVDDDLIHHIRNDFKKIESYGLSDTVGDGEIETLTLFEHLVQRGQILDSNRVAPGSTRQERRNMRKRTTTLRQQQLSSERTAIPDCVVDMMVPDRGFSEWRDDLWKPYLENDPEYVQSVDAHNERRTKVATRVRAGVSGALKIPRGTSRSMTKMRSSQDLDA